MDVITISGLQFPMRPDVTIRHLLDVFRGIGRVGLIQRDGIVEYLDTPVDFSAGSSYDFVDATDIFDTKIDTIQNIQVPGYFPNRIPNVTAEEVLRNRGELSNQISSNLTSLNQNLSGTVNQREQQLAWLNGQVSMLNKEMPLKQGLNSIGLPQRVLQPKFFQHVLLKAPKEGYLNLNQIAVLNMKQENIAMNGALESSGIFVGDTLMRSGVQPLSGLMGVRSAMPGGWIRLGFTENRDNAISSVILKPSDSLNGSRLEIRRANEYSVATLERNFAYVNAYPSDMVNVIEIRAPSDRFLQLNQIVITNGMGRPVVDIVKFESSDLSATRTDLTAQELLFGSTNINEDFIRSSNYGGFIRLTLANPMSIQSVHLFGELQGIKVSLERNQSYMCSGDLIQTYAL